MNDLVVFLNARLDEGEAIVEITRSGGFPAPAWTTEPARAGGWEILHEADDPTPLGYVTRGRREHEHVARYDPARALREIKAKRNRLKRYLEQPTWHLPEGVRDTDQRQRDQTVKDVLEGEVREDAAVYDDHPDYRQEWKPC